MPPDLEKALRTFAATGPVEGELQVSASSGTGVSMLTGPSRHDLDEAEAYAWSQVFAVLPSSRQSWWLLPVGNRECSIAGSRIYMPYALRARLLKKVLLTAIRLAPNSWARRKALVSSTEPLLLQQLVTRLTGERHPVFSLILGTPGPFRKLTVLVMRPNGDAIGYVKLPLSPAATGCVMREAAALRELSKFPSLRPFIPELIYSGDWQGAYILFESSGPRRSGPLSLGPPHQRFLEILRSVYTVEKAGGTLVNQVAERWQKIVATVHPSLRGFGARSLEYAERDLAGCTVPCGIMHGDFAPWNTRLTEQGNLFVFDWEYADWEAPISWDVFHFSRQTARLLKKQKARNKLRSVRGEPTERANFLLYLLSRISNSYASGGPTASGLNGWLTTFKEQLG